MASKLVHRPPLRCEVVSDLRRLEELSSEWARLWKSDSQAEIFQTPEWTIAWWRSFGQGNILCSLVVFAEDEVVGIVPLAMRNGVIEFLGTPEADYADIICEEEWAAEVLAVALKTLSESVTGWSECVWQHLSKDSRALRHYPGLSRELRGSLHCIATGCCQTIILGDQSDTVFQSLLGKEHTRRLQNRLQKAGQVRFRHLETQQEAETYLDDFFRHHVRRHAVLGRQSSCARPEYRQFVRELIKELGPAEKVRFGILELDSRPLAWHLGFQVNGKFLLYQHTFDLDAWDYSAGELLLWNLLEYAKDHVAREFDFGCGDEAYKCKFATHTRETFSLYVEPPDLRGRLRGWLRAGQGYSGPLARHIRKRAKAHSSTFRLLRSIRIATGGVLRRIRKAKKEGALPQHWLHWTAQVFRKAVWGKEELNVFPWERLVGPDGSPFTCSRRNGNDEVEITTGRFGDLVDLATERPDAVVASELSGFRSRPKKGDRFYIGRKSGHVVLLGWTSTGNVDDVLTRKLISPDRQTLVTYDSWPEPGLSDGALYRQFLSVLRLEAASKKLDLVIRCRPDQVTFRTELEHQGFPPQYRIVRYSLFHWLRWTRHFQTKQTVADPLLAGRRSKTISFPSCETRPVWQSPSPSPDKCRFHE
jgi:CelD/BcsL family acetyltransferase involved in cellulose biosynthesis